MICASLVRLFVFCTWNPPGASFQLPEAPWGFNPSLHHHPDRARFGGQAVAPPLTCYVTSGKPAHHFQRLPILRAAVDVKWDGVCNHWVQRPAHGGDRRMEMKTETLDCSCSPHNDYFKRLSPSRSRPQLSVSADCLESKLKPTSMISTSFLLLSPPPPYHPYTFSGCF